MKKALNNAAIRISLLMTCLMVMLCLSVLANVYLYNYGENVRAEYDSLYHDWKSCQSATLDLRSEVIEKEQTIKMVSINAKKLDELE